MAVTDPPPPEDPALERVEELRALIGRQTRTSIRRVLEAHERIIQPLIADHPDEIAEFRKSLLDELNDSSDVMTRIAISAEEGAIFNAMILDHLQVIRSAVQPKAT